MRAYVNSALHSAGEAVLNSGGFCQVAIDDRELLTEQNVRFLRGHFVGSAQGSGKSMRKSMGYGGFQ